MRPEIMQNIAQLIVCIGLIFTALGGYGHFYYGKKIDSNKEVEINQKLVSIPNEVNKHSNKNTVEVLNAIEDVKLSVEEIAAFDDSTLQVPTITTNNVTNITQISLTSGGGVTSDNGATVNERGICWCTCNNPTINDKKLINGTGAGNFEIILNELQPNTQYYIRAYATNKNGTGYGSTMAISTEPFGMVTDVDGNQYRTLVLGNQEWMYENLKVRKYQNGESILHIMNDSEWINQTIGAYCNYDNLGVNGENYGHLYNSNAIKDKRNICPTGWHIPSNTEVTNLKSLIGAENLDKICFFENGGGYRQSHDGSFVRLGESSFWTSTSRNSSANWGFSNELTPNFTGTKHGFSVRCVKDL